MFSKLNIYLLRNFIYSFLIIFTLFLLLVFFSDLIEQFRKSANKNVSIKATTTEKLGFIGRKEGIMAQCLTTISRPI